MMILISFSMVSAYDNLAHGFSITPPSGWSIEENTSEGVIVMFRDIPSGSTISVVGEEASYSLLELVAIMKQTLTDYYENYTFVSEGSREIGGLDCYEIVYTNTYLGINWKNKLVFFVDLGKYFLVTCSAVESQYANYSLDFENCIETFRITGAQQDVPVGNSSSISCELSSTTIRPGESVTYSGYIFPSRSEVTVYLKYSNDNGETFINFDSVETNSVGFYSATSTWEGAGLVIIQSYWNGDEEYRGANSSIQTLRIEEEGEFEPTTPEPIEPEAKLPQTGITLSSEWIAIILSIGGLAAGAGTWVFRTNSERKRNKILFNKLMEDIDDVYSRFRMNTLRCEAELYKYKDQVLEDFKQGMINEEKYKILDERINNYLKDIIKKHGKEKKS